MPLYMAVNALESGRILALKGLGGFQLACDAFRSSAVDGLRLRKRRGRRPFAVMMQDLLTVDRFLFHSRCGWRPLARPYGTGLCTPYSSRGYLPFRRRTPTYTNRRHAIRLFTSCYSRADDQR
jgi:hypothetical protein